MLKLEADLESHIHGKEVCTITKELSAQYIWAQVVGAAGELLANVQRYMHLLLKACKLPTTCAYVSTLMCTQPRYLTLISRPAPTAAKRVCSVITWHDQAPSLDREESVSPPSVHCAVWEGVLAVLSYGIGSCSSASGMEPHCWRMQHA